MSASRATPGTGLARVAVEAEGDPVGIATSKSMLSAIDLGGIESAKRTPRA